MKAAPIRMRSGDLRQFAAVRRITLDDGPERGVRALAFSSGGGLDFWVLSDRSLDIGPLWWRGLPLAWQAPAGFSSPALHDAEGDRGFGFNRSFSGFLVTCGLDHIRQPANGHPLHGRLPFTPARVTAYGEDWDRDEPVLFCEGEVVQARFGGEAFRLTRRIEAVIGGSCLSITDEVENIGTSPTPQASLYHFNLGFPALADGTRVERNGQRLLGPLVVPDPAASRDSIATAIEHGDVASCRVSTPSLGTAGLGIDFTWGRESLPYLQLWHDLRPHACVLGIEPCTSARQEGGLSGPENKLMPGERRIYQLRVTMRELSDAVDVTEL
ncbi:Galactose mutarotase-like enzyme [Hyphomicrobiales bacterium]|nr:Galactose mutarotase-like enzyme [Hyphomicrobiales bacterium]CAH1688616.1 Galactose mutarotase-like enzyme [Hyphomicrobiales bacterium]